MKIVSTTPYPLAIRFKSHGWEILCPPGPLAQLFSHLAHTPQPQSALIDGQMMHLIPLTPDLDTALESLVDALINLRYDTGRVQLELFSEEGI